MAERVVKIESKDADQLLYRNFVRVLTEAYLAEESEKENKKKKVS